MEGKLDKPQTTEIIFLLKALCGFIEAKKEEEGGGGDDEPETLKEMAEEYTKAKAKYYPDGTANGRTQ